MYWNPKQIEFLQSRHPIRTFLAGRGSGKSTVIGGTDLVRMREMPRAKGFLSSSTYNQILTKTLPAMEAKWQEAGMKEGIHYVVGKRPPVHFERPYQMPRKFENCVFFHNGYCREFLSMDRPDLARGGSYQFGDVDEAALVTKEENTLILLPMLRGFRHKFSSELYRQMGYYSSIPWKPSGYWLFDYEDKAKAYPDKYKWLESTALDNIEVLGYDYIQTLEDEMPYLEYQVEVLNKRVRKTPDAFYHKFDPEVHTYQVRYLYDEGERGYYTKGIADPHYTQERLIDVSFDFSGWFNCCTSWQEGNVGKRFVEYCLHQFFVKDGDGKIGELVDKFCEHYKGHKTKLVRIWGEPRGHDKRADTEQTIYEQIRARFLANGWACEIRVKAGQVKAHKERNWFMNDVLAESTPALPIVRINDITCKDFIIAMQVTDVAHDFQKNKTKEKDRAYPQEHAPHFTDTLDYYLMQKHGWRAGNRIERTSMSATIR